MENNFIQVVDGSYHYWWPERNHWDYYLNFVNCGYYYKCRNANTYKCDTCVHNKNVKDDYYESRRPRNDKHYRYPWWLRIR